MEAITDFLGSSSFWRILLFFHFLMAVVLMAAITLQTMATLMPLQQPAGNVAGSFVERIRSAPPNWFVIAVIILYFPSRWFAGVKARRKSTWLSYL